jgi:SAM-dependent methyltransferase
MIQTCTVCGNTLAPRFPRVLDPITRETFAIHACTGCGLGHTVPQPDDLSRYYGPLYHGSRHGFTSRYCTLRRLRFLSSARAAESGRRLLDIGCGDGSFLLAARDAGWEVMGTEMNPAPARSAGLDIREAIGQVPHDAAFDCITMWHSLEHMRDIRATLSQVSALLKPTGKLLIAVPDAGGLQAGLFRHQWLHLDVPRHLYHFDAGSLSHCLRSAGFTPQYWWHQELEYDLMGWSQSALNTLFPVPNVFLDSLMGKPRKAGFAITAASVVIGSILSALFLPAVPAGTLVHRGGTLVVAAARTE